MKSLKTIQVFCKIGKILSKIAFIFSIVAAACCLSSVGILATLGALDFTFDGETFSQFFNSTSDVSLNTLIVAMAVAAVFCAGEIVVAKFAEIYFNSELKDGTPFTYKGCKQLLRLGIIAIAVPVACAILNAIIVGVCKATMADVGEVSLDGVGGIGVGVAILIIALLCKYGADVTKDGATQTEQATPTEQNDDDLTEVHTEL